MPANKKKTVLANKCHSLLFEIRTASKAGQTFSKAHPYFCRMEDVSAHTKAILGLQLPTDPRWVNLAEKSIADVLTDHAYCEQKAAVSCI